MTLIKWAPRPASIFDDMDKMINNVFENDWNFPVRSKTNWSPAVDVKESDNSFTLTADILFPVNGNLKMKKKAVIITIANADMVLFHGRSIYLKL